jgi:hypothetical protein
MASNARGDLAMRERRDSDVSGRRDSDVTGRRDTHRGLGEVEASFSPSDPSELTPEELALGKSDAFDFHFPSDAKIPSIPENDRPLDDLSEDTPTGPTGPNVTQRSPDRRRFDTSTGGGSNRVSGGRDVARAYVAPMTPAPVHLRVQDTISIEVNELVNQFDTIPSLTRRRLAEEDFFSLPHTRRRRRRLVRALWVAALAVISGIGVGLFVRWAHQHTSRTDSDVEVVTPSASAVPAPPAPSAAVLPSPAAQKPSSPPAAAPATASPQEPASTKPARKAPSRSKPASSSKASKSSSAELWLE